MAFGETADTSPGTSFSTRRALYDAGVHRTLQAGIVGSEGIGAESIVLSGGYVDDEDRGDEIVYTGHGARDPATGRQIADQTFTRQNQALVRNCLEGLPVRVIRGSQHVSSFSPASGYRYDGLYRVESYWRSPGRDGFLVCRFRLVAGGDPAVAPDVASELVLPAKRAIGTISRIIRDTAVSRRVKEIHDHRCQVCDTRLECVGGPYAEAAHIRPLGAPHDGPDVVGNVLCLCPNHHVLFDNGGFTLDDDALLIGIPGRLRVHPMHSLERVFIEYHKSIWATKIVEGEPNN